MAAFTFLAVKRKNRENHTMLGLLALSNGEGKKITEQMERWEKDS